MKKMDLKIIFILISCNTFLLANVTQLQKLYDKGEYNSVTIQAKSYTSSYTDSKLHLLWAKSAKKLGNVEEAMSAYERVVMLDDTDTESRFALLEIYQDTNRDELVFSMSQELEKFQLTQAQQNILKKLKAVDIDSLRVRLNLSVGEDSNINVNPGAKVLDDYYSTTNSSDKLKTEFMRVLLSLNYTNELGEKGGWYAKADLNGFYQDNFQEDADSYDISFINVALGVGYSSSPYNIYIPISYDKVNYLDKALLSSVKLSPVLKITLSSDMLLNIDASYTKRTYEDSVDTLRDDSSVGLGVGFYYRFNSNYAYINAKYDSYSSTNDTYAKFTDKKLLTATLGVKYTPTSWLSTKSSYRYRKGTYDDNIGTPLAPKSSKRSDDYHQLELKLSHFFTKNYEIYLSDRYITNSSNYKPAEYDKNIAMLGLGISY